MFDILKISCVVVVLMLNITSCLLAEVSLPAIISDHMVLQQQTEVPIWGWAEAGENVTVTFGNQIVNTKADAKGNWQVKLKDLKAGAAGTLEIQGKTNKITVQDVLVGEVWLGSGQSNMAMQVSGCKDYQQELKQADYPQIRMFKEESGVSQVAELKGKGKWQICSAETVGKFSATLYFFGREIHQQLKVPVGLINSSVGGTPIESWIDPASQKSAPELKPFFNALKEEQAKVNLVQEKANYEKQLAAWNQAVTEAKAAGKNLPRKPENPAVVRAKKANVGGLYLGKIAPLVPYRIKGAIWYQGEANTFPDKVPYYKHQLPLIVKDWRAKWGYDFPFAWAQLPNYQVEVRNWPLIREAMLQSLSVPGTGMGINIDIGESNDIHPKNKQEVGRRLSLWALGTVYQVPVPATSGPLPAGYEIKGNEVVLKFTHATGLKADDPKEIAGFIIAGADKVWHKGTAKIVGETVVVSSDKVHTPVAVRYLFENDPQVKFIRNSAGLPMTPFRTDDWEDEALEMKTSFVDDANANSKTLTLERIYGGDEFREDQPGRIYWSDLGKYYFLLKKSTTDDAGDTLLRVDPSTGQEELLVSSAHLIPAGQTEPLKIDSFTFSADESKLLIFTNSKKVWRQKTRGDYWVLNLASKKLQQLGGDASPATMMFAKFSPTGDQVAYVRQNNIYVQDLDTLKVTRITVDGGTNIINGTADWVNEEELSIRDGFRWSPDGKSIAFWSFDTTGVGEYHLLNNTAGTYPVITSFPYPKVGTKNSATRVCVCNLKTGIIRSIELPGDPREHYIPHMEWTPDGKAILIQQMNRLQNKNIVFLADLEDGSLRTVLTETDAAWLENENPFRFVDQGKHFIWLSERSGWRHAYLASLNGKPLVPITSGEFDVLLIEKVDQANGWLYFSAAPKNPTERHLFRVAIAGGQPQQVSPNNEPGWHTYDISPDATYAVHRYSTIKTPTVTKLIELKDQRVLRVLEDNSSLKEKLAQLDAPSMELFQVDNGAGVMLDGWCMKPPGFDPAKKYPLIVYVYGEPHGQTVKNSWQGATGLWHMMLAQQGYLVLSIDNRGTNTPRGREWRKCVYRKIGIIAPVEQAAAIKNLCTRWSYIDAKRIGVWGWSGGGSMSLNAIFRYPELYKTAIAVAPNADQLLYDTIYQERYMGLPDDNAEGYRQGSPITHAENLQGNLLVVHGTGDDNGHFQGTEKLMNKLIALNKQFSVMPYPARSHSINEGENTVLHFHQLLTNYFHTHLPVNDAQ